MAGMTWGQAIAGGVDRGVDTAMQARRMKLYEGRESREQEEFERAERDKQELDEAMAVAMENQQKGQGNTLEPPKRKVMGPDGREIEKEINPATWAKAVVATRSLDKSITDDINNTILKARQKGLAAAKMRGLGGLEKLAEVYGEVTGETPTIKPDPKTGKIQVLGQDGSLWQEYDSPDQAYEETMTLLEPDKIANYVINQKQEEAKAAREVKTFEEKENIKSQYGSSRKFNKLTRKTVDANGVEVTEEIPVAFDERTGAASRIELGGEIGDDDYDAFKKKALGGSSR